MKHQGTKFSHWLLCIIVFLILFPIFFFPYFSFAARRSPYTIDALDHDFPYLNCSMRVIDADVRDVLRTFANKYELNIIMSEEVKGTISIIINNIPVKEAFKNILQYSDLGYIKEKNVYRIKSLQSMLGEERLTKTTKNLYTEINFCHIYIKFHGIKGYGWVFPKKNHVNVGLVSYNIKKTENKKIHLKDIFYEYLSYLQSTHILPSTLKSTNMQGGLLPAQPVRKTYTDRILLSGDAAGLINPISGEGIYYALVSGEIAGKVAANAIQAQDTSEKYLSSYHKEWNQDFGREIKLLLKSKDQWGKEGEKVITLMKNDKKFAELIFIIMMGKESAYDLRWKLIKQYLYAKLHPHIKNTS